MANSKRMQVSMLILLILLVFVTILEANGHPGRKIMQKRTDSHSILSELGYDLSKLKHSRKDTRDRVSPGGPDSHHHFQPMALP